VVVLVALAAPFGLKFFGHEYSARGALLLSLLALAVLPKALIELYIGVLRVQNRTRLIALLQAARLAGVLALIPVVIDPDRLATIGLVIVGVNTVVAATVLPGLAKAVRPVPSPATGERDIS